MTYTVESHWLNKPVLPLPADFLGDPELYLSSFSHTYGSITVCGRKTFPWNRTSEPERGNVPPQAGSLTKQINGPRPTARFGLSISILFATGSSGGGLKAATRKIHSPQESLSPNQRAAPESKSSSRYQ
nr:unnamed protein product [Callosobruchus chinensis]